MGATSKTGTFRAGNKVGTMRKGTPPPPQGQQTTTTTHAPISPFGVGEPPSAVDSLIQQASQSASSTSAPSEEFSKMATFRQRKNVEARATALISRMSHFLFQFMGLVPHMFSFLNRGRSSIPETTLHRQGDFGHRTKLCKASPIYGRGKKGVF